MHETFTAITGKDHHARDSSGISQMLAAGIVPEKTVRLGDKGPYHTDGTPQPDQPAGRSGLDHGNSCFPDKIAPHGRSFRPAA